MEDDKISEKEELLKDYEELNQRNKDVEKFIKIAKDEIEKDER